MSNMSKAVELICDNIAGKRVLEAACGSGEFTLEAAKTAAHVDCIDLDGQRLLPEIAQQGNVAFWEMDASAMAFPDNSFDTVVLYNAVGHIGDRLEKVIDECVRVAKGTGGVYIISSWMMDKCAIEDDVLPLLRNKGVIFNQEKPSPFTMVRF